jgi:GT2 family glycosyltransferase
MKSFIGIPSYNRSKVLRYCLSSFLGSKVVQGFIIVAQGTTEREYTEYAKTIKQAMFAGYEVNYMLTNKRLGSAKARNEILKFAKNNLSKHDILIMYDDDFIYPGDHTLLPALYWLKQSSIGLVGGKVINLRRRKVDPDFHLNLYPLADIITQLTGFIVLDIKHGPRETNFVSHPLAMRVEIIDKGIKYDENYRGTGYREESDLQKQVRELGYKIIFEPRFYTYHFALERGGNRYSDTADRIYWKWRNHTYFMNKWRYPIYKKVINYTILTIYALLNGPSAIMGVIKAVKTNK